MFKVGYIHRRAAESAEINFFYCFPLRGTENNKLKLKP